MTTSPIHIDLDIAIIGGGVAGLWLANRLKAQGFHIALFESKALGSDQTMASQGMIHGGMKYTLSGMLTGASEAIAEMPQHWDDVDGLHTLLQMATWRPAAKEVQS